MAVSSREEFVYIAKMAEQAERYEEMVEFMEKVSAATYGNKLTVEERNLLVNHFFDRAEGREPQQAGNVSHVNTIRDYKAKIESEISGICDGILNLLESTLIPSGCF